MSDKMISGKMTRRQVLSRATAVGLTGLAAPYVIPSGVLARAGMTGANDRIVVAGIGVRRPYAMRCPDASLQRSHGRLFQAQGLAV